MSSAGRLTRGALAAAEDFASLSTRECLIFAQAVYEHGAQQSVWSEIAGILSKHPLISRPKNFFTAQSCTAIYNYLMNQAQLERTQDSESKKAQVNLKLAQRHYIERLSELRRDIAAEEEKFRSIEQEIAEIRLGKQDHKWTNIIHGSASSVPPSPKSPAGSSNSVKPKSPSVVDVPAPTTDATPLQDFDTVDEDVKDESMEISSPVSKEHEINIQEEIPEVKLDDIPERQTRHSNRRRRSTGASQSIATPSPSTALRSASPTSPNSPRVEEEPRSKTGRKPPSKGEQIEPILESSLEESVEEDVQVEDYQDVEGMKTPGEEEMGRMSQPAEEDQNQELPVQSHESTPAPPGRRDRKRRASDVDGFPSESLREKKRAREESEPFDDADSPATPSASAVGTSRNQKGPSERKRFQNVIYMLHSQISQHRNGTIFHNPIKPSEAPDYHDIVKRPMDLKTIKNRVRDGIISTSSEYQRDIYLMFANSLMYNRPNSDIYTMAEEMMNDAEAHINSFRQTEGFTARTRTS